MSANVNLKHINIVVFHRYIHFNYICLPSVSLVVYLCSHPLLAFAYIPIPFSFRVWGRSMPLAFNRSTFDLFKENPQRKHLSIVVGLLIVPTVVPG